MYTKEVLKHFKNPKNLGRIEEADGVGRAGNIRCGDVMELYIRVGGDEVLEDVKFETFGCVAAIATSSVITERAKGKTLDEVLKLDKSEIIKELGGLPPVKLHCSVLAVDALQEAVYDYFKKEGREIPRKLEERHARIQKTKKEMETRYEDWTEAEEEMIRGES